MGYLKIPHWEKRKDLSKEEAMLQEITESRRELNKLKRLLGLYASQKKKLIVKNNLLSSDNRLLRNDIIRLEGVLYRTGRKLPR